MRVTLREIQRMSGGGGRIAVVTAHDHPSAVLADLTGGTGAVASACRLMGGAGASRTAARSSAADEAAPAPALDGVG